MTCKHLCATLALTLLPVCALQVQTPAPESLRGSKPMQPEDGLKTVAPALENAAEGPIAELWKRPALSPRNRSIVTVAALIARNQTIEMPHGGNTGSNPVGDANKTQWLLESSLFAEGLKGFDKRSSLPDGRRTSSIGKVFRKAFLIFAQPFRSTSLSGTAL